jgi:lycopene cyclase domain-containing protein
VEYTWGSVLAVLAVVGIEVFWFRTGIFGKLTFWVSYAIILFFQVLVDGWLTKLSAPIVVYNADKNSGIRFPWDIPVEDYLFGFALIVLTILLWERAGRDRGAGAGGPSGRTGTPLTRRR